jgi:hypothetical protein
MTAFEFLSVALSFVLGLAVTLVLTSLLAAFRARRESKMDWLPFVWAGYVLVYQFQYWWAIFELSAVPVWTVGTFGVLLLLAVILFLAGGLTLPTGSADYPDDLGEYFRSDGRWGVAALAAYSVVGSVGNFLLFGTPILSPLTAIQAGAVGSAAVTVAAKNRMVQVAATLVFGVLLAIGATLATPGSY